MHGSDPWIRSMYRTHRSASGKSRPQGRSRFLKVSQGLTRLRKMLILTGSHKVRRCSSSQRFTKELARSHEVSEGPTRSHKVSQGVIWHHKAPQGLTRSHKVSKGPQRSHKVSQGLTRSHKVSQGLTRSRKVPQGFTRPHKAPQGLTGIPHRLALIFEGSRRGLRENIYRTCT